MSPRRIDTLTDTQRDAMTAHADQWIAHGWSTQPADWELFEDAARRCYQYTGLPWHGNVVRVSSPLVLSLAAPAAAYALEFRRRLGAGAVDGAVDDAVRVAVDGAVHGAVGDAVDVAVHGAVDDAVDGAVHGAVDDAVRDAVDGAVRRTILNAWFYRLWGNLYPTWQAYTSYFRDHCDLELDGDMWDRSRAYEDTAKAAGWWWPHKEFVMVCDRPAVLHLEQVGPRGWGSHRLHCDDGPAIAWRDGWALHYLHGVRVPAAVVEEPREAWTVDRLIRELDNSEVRRVAIERVGWDVLEAQLGEPVAVAADPANWPHELKLYDLPDDLFEEPVRLVCMTNASPDKDGTRTRRYGETVPAHIADPVAAQAWAWDVDPGVYRQLQRAT